jgi:coenzyme A diphosphatase NUDT7
MNLNFQSNFYFILFFKMRFSLLLRSNFDVAQKISILKSKLAPFNRPDYLNVFIRKEPNIGSLKRTSVLIPISIDKNGDTYLTLTRRSQHLKSFKGECCFIGGNYDEDDKTAVETALREAEEEVGMGRKALDVICQFTPIFTTFGKIITPVIAIFDDTKFEPKLNTDEVDLIFKVPTSHFISSEHHRLLLTRYKKDHFYIHYYDWMHQGEKLVIEGVTSTLSVNICSIIHSKLPEFRIDPVYDVNLDNINDYMEWLSLDCAREIVKDIVTTGKTYRLERTHKQKQK